MATTKFPSTRVEVFSNREIQLVRADSDDVARFWDESAVGVEQAEHRPTHLVIGRRASDERLGKLAARVGIDIAALTAFRDGRLESLQVAAR